MFQELFQTSPAAAKQAATHFGPGKYPAWIMPSDPGRQDPRRQEARAEEDATWNIGGRISDNPSLNEEM